MKGDLQFGLVTAVVLVLAAASRLLPELDQSATTSVAGSGSGSSVTFEPKLEQADELRPSVETDPDQPLRLPELDLTVPPSANPASALTDVAPDAYRARQTAESSSDGRVNGADSSFGPTPSMANKSNEATVDSSSAGNLDSREKSGFTQPESSGPADAKTHLAPAKLKPPVHPYYRRYLERGEYFVRPGDTLGNIAKRLYGEEEMATSILEANSDRLKSAEDLKPGQLIRLPYRRGSPSTQSRS
jgi:hypothetical protein